jgi:hypothetical protein
VVHVPCLGCRRTSITFRVKGNTIQGQGFGPSPHQRRYPGQVPPAERREQKCQRAVGTNNWLQGVCCLLVARRVAS